MKFQVRFPLSDIAIWSEQYSYSTDTAISDAVATASSRGFLTKEELLVIGEWKSARIRSRLAINSDHDVQEISKIAMSATSELLRIGALRLLTGVGWPVASVILHFCHNEPYPILDFRAIWSLSQVQPAAYSFEYWQAYTDACRRIAREANVDMRTLDRALWQYSKAKQPTSRLDNF